jgi:non-ribosomal peptide synthetase component F
MMRRLQQQEAEARQYDYSPLVDIQRWSDVGRGQPLFDSILVFENYPGNPLLGKHSEKQEDNTGVEDGKIVLKSGMPRTNYPMTVEVLPGDRLGLLINYDRSRFEAETIKFLLEQLQSILEQILRSPQILIGDLSLVTKSSTAVLPDPRRPIPEPNQKPITLLFEDCAAKAPANSAVSQGSKSWTYGQLAESARALGAILLYQGVNRGDVVAVQGSPSYGLISSLLGILASGGVLLTIDVGLPVQRKNLMLREANAKFMLMVGDEPEDGLGELSIPILCIDPDTGRALSNDEPAGESTIMPEIRPDAAAYIFFTSGTTGIPKGVLGRHKGLSHFLTWQRDTFGVEPGDRCAQLTGLSFDVMLRDIFLPLISGATLCLPTREDTLRPESLMFWLERERISLLHMVPSLAQMWLIRAQSGPQGFSLRRAFFAGEPLSSEMVKQWREAFPQSRIINLYGPTETTLAKCFYEVPEDVEPGVQPVGHPIAQSEVLILNGEESFAA